MLFQGFTRLFRQETPQTAVEDHPMLFQGFPNRQG